MVCLHSSRAAHRCAVPSNTPFYKYRTYSMVEDECVWTGQQSPRGTADDVDGTRCKRNLL